MKKEDKISMIKNKREREFAETFFNHNAWQHEPPSLRLPNGDVYHADFYDADRGVYIEVAGSRQAYNANKDKYAVMQRMLPGIEFEIRKPNGKIYTPRIPLGDVNTNNDPSRMCRGEFPPVPEQCGIHPKAYLDIEKIENFRWDSHLKKGRFAAMIGIRPSSYSKMIARRNLPDAQVLLRIARVMGVEGSDLIVY